MSTKAPTCTGGERQGRAAGRRAFVLHLVEMLVVMVVGMGVFGALTAMAYGAAGSSVSGQPGWLRITLMGVDMAVPMAVWMAVRGHRAGRNVEMAAAMLVPSLAAAALTRFEVVGTEAALGVQHVVMLAAMLAVMLWRYDEYAHRHQRRRA